MQNNGGTHASSFNPNLQYGPSLFDRTHVFNAIFNYDLPAGKGHKFSFSNSVLDKIISGWYVTGVFRANSGLPIPVVGGDFGGGAVLQQRQYDCDGRSQFAGSQRSQQCLRNRWSQRTDLWKRW